MNTCKKFIVIYPIGPEIIQPGQSGGLSDCHWDLQSTKTVNYQLNIFKREGLKKKKKRSLTHVRIKGVVQVPVQVSYGATTPVLKDVQIGLSLILPEENREGDEDAGNTPSFVCYSEVEQLTTVPHYLVNKNQQTHTSLDT